MNIRLNVTNDGRPVRSLEFAEGTYSVGSLDSDVTLQYPTVSRHHGSIEVRSNEVLFRDTESHNGSYWRGPVRKREPIPPNHSVAWMPDEAIGVGPFTLRWEPASSANEPDLRAICAKFAQTYARLLVESPAQAHEILCQELESHPLQERILENLHAEFHGDGPIGSFLSNTQCREILMNGYSEIYVDTGDGLRRLPHGFTSQTTFDAWVSRTVHNVGRRLDLQNPICEATLPNGARFHAVLFPISAKATSVAIRRFGSAPLTEEQALQSKWVAPSALDLMKKAIHTRKNIVISGGTSTGKTSLLNFLCQYLNPNERVLSIEDTVELSPPVKNLVQLQARTANADGVGQIALRQLVQCALRMRPDRIIVGECRGAEVLEMLQALNTGHPGSLTTIHANSTQETLQRLELLTLLGASNLSIECIREWIHASLDMIIQVERTSWGCRRVAQIAVKTGSKFETVYVCTS